jgi:hypothetical protein
MHTSTVALASVGWELRSHDVSSDNAQNPAEAAPEFRASGPDTGSAGQCIMKERPTSGLNVGMAPPPLRYAVQGLRSAAAALGDGVGGKNCSRV